MLLRIFFDNRWIPVNLPANSYPEHDLDILTARLTHVLTHAPGRASEDWADLQVIELESTSEGWLTTLYWNKERKAAETIVFR